jgi:peptidoglycan hydrolase-like protein with peptidoglycan-binding domain
MIQLDPSITFDGPVPQVQPRPSSPQPTDKPIRDGIWLQNSLNRLGANPKLVLDGIVGPATRNAVRAFQIAQGITVDGLVGPETFAALDKALDAGKPVKTIPVPPDITLGERLENLAGTFWARVTDLFKH